MQVYFSENFSAMEFVIVNGGLHSLFQDYARHVPAEERDTCLGYAHMCRANLETALYDLPLHLPTTQDTITGLLFGVC